MNTWSWILIFLIAALGAWALTTHIAVYLGESSKDWMTYWNYAGFGLSVAISTFAITIFALGWTSGN